MLHIGGSIICTSCIIYQVDWEQASMIEAERLLLTHALEDTYNQRFVFLSDSQLMHPRSIIVYQMNISFKHYRQYIIAPSNSYRPFMC
ncbi:hypothetical protein FEM48_Zijuj10G0006400 [Ziziphus jujuba var. spinosa]|uniref:Uncharacterized protein n=1 Tax=Ziziphus jujuba var. spinosa TaxID=714518 RepID=A0A978UK93_ZIZJJ|nr:hypothetical protein FEM48_Zijuj10G0006400 [Ziziphus jujuba var. spinosa]